MDFVDKINDVAAKIPRQIEYCTTEEATKNALILPFIQALGYDIFDPTEVMPELTADFGTKKGEKVDYAILQDGKPIVLFECKRAETDLAKVHASQLYRYFSVLPEVRFGVLTDGIRYWFYSDLDAPNRMDDRPFFVFDMSDYQERHVHELKKFTKSTFDLDEILATASELKYTAAITAIISSEFEQPSDDFVVFLARQVYTGHITRSVRERFSETTKKAFRRFLNERISDRLKTALEVTGNAERAESVPVEEEAEEQEPVEGVVIEDRKRGIVTTEDEIEGYFAVKSLLRDAIDVKRLHLKDTKSYCNVLLDDNTRKPICRMYFNRDQKYIGLFDDERREERIAIDDVDDIYDYAERIIATAKWYDLQHGAQPSRSAKTEAKATDRAQNFTGKSLRAFVLNGKRYEVGTWREALFGILSLLRASDPEGFERIAVTMRGRKRPYITRDSGQLRAPESLTGTDLYVETNLSSQMIARLCFAMVEKMGRKADSLNFDVG